MSNNKQLLKADYEWVTQAGDESIHYIQHGVPSSLIRWHHHREYELRLVRSTSGKMFVGDYIGNFAPGNLVLVGPDLPHNWISELAAGESIALRDQVVHFSSDFVQGLQALMPEMRAIEPLLRRAQWGIEFRGEDTIRQAIPLFDQIAGAQGMKRLARFLTLLELLASVSNYRTLSSEYHQPLIDKKHLDWLNQAVGYILQHYARELPLDEVSQQMGMSGTQFSKHFKRVAGHCFVDFVNQLRINKASELLAQSDLPITEICFDVGYNSIANFNRRFLEIKGMTPSEYRKTYLNVLYSC
jgi:AraC-like DNA-binding protein